MDHFKSVANTAYGDRTSDNQLTRTARFAARGLKNPAPAPDLGMPRRQINRCRPRRAPENRGRVYEQLPLPVRNLVGVNLKLCRQIG
jgi:hypothetical protein